MPSEKFMFENAKGDMLAAQLDRPEGDIRSVALFAHCFTCSKDIFAAQQIAKQLNANAIAVLRFDFTGLGASEGEFENTNFSSNVEDILAAAAALEGAQMAPQLLIGHSLGGAAVLKAARRIPSLKAVVTIAAPFDPGHVEHNFDDWISEIETDGEANVQLVGRPFRIKRQFLDDIRSQSIADDTSQMRAALLILHSPTDQTVGIENAERIFVHAKHPKSFVSLDDADHLLSKREDAQYVADVISGWAAPYLASSGRAEEKPVQKASQIELAGDGSDTAVHFSESTERSYTIHGRVGSHRFIADEPASLGGKDLGPTPFGYLKAALGACTLITLRMYIRRKQWDIPPLHVAVDYNNEDGEHVFARTLTIPKDLDTSTRDKLLDIADKCPVHKALSSGARVYTQTK